MATMGEMISLITHQWRQPLSAINTTIMGIKIKLATGKFDLSSKSAREDFLQFLQEKHNKIDEYTKILSTTTDDFRNFFNPNVEKELTTLHSPIERALSIVSMSLQTKGITLYTTYDKSLHYTLYHNKLVQVILNLLKNAEDQLTLGQQVSPEISITTYQEEETLNISISDNAGGIPENILPIIFDPYFSTKDEKKGTGLGLLYVKNYRRRTP